MITLDLAVALVSIGDVDVWHTGSRAICNPPPTDTDDDWLVLVKTDERQEAHDAMEALGFEEGSNDTEDYDNRLRRNFTSYRKESLNIILTFKEEFYTRFKAATEFCKVLNVQLKPERVAIFRYFLYGEGLEAPVSAIENASLNMITAAYASSDAIMNAAGMGSPSMYPMIEGLSSNAAEPSDDPTEAVADSGHVPTVTHRGPLMTTTYQTLVHGVDQNGSSITENIPNPPRQLRSVEWRGLAAPSRDYSLATSGRILHGRIVAMRENYNQISVTADMGTSLLHFNFEYRRAFIPPAPEINLDPDRAIAVNMTEMMASFSHSRWYPIRDAVMESRSEYLTYEVNLDGRVQRVRR